MSKKYTIDVDHDLIDKIVQDTLIADYKMVTEDIARLESNEDTLKDFQREDLIDLRKWQDSLKSILQYYMPMSEYKNFFNK